MKYIIEYTKDGIDPIGAYDMVIKDIIKLYTKKTIGMTSAVFFRHFYKLSDYVMSIPIYNELLSSQKKSQKNSQIIILPTKYAEIIYHICRAVSKPISNYGAGVIKGDISYHIKLDFESMSERYGLPVPSYKTIKLYHSNLIPNLIKHKYGY